MDSNINFENLISSSCSKKIVMQAAEIVSHHPEKLSELWELIHSNKSNAWKAAWIFSTAAQKSPTIAAQYLESITEEVPNLSNSGAIRELLKVLIIYPLPENPSGELLDFCLASTMNPQLPVGVRMYCMELASKYCDKYPELKIEFKSILEEVINEAPSIGTKHRAARLLNAL